MFGDTLPPPPAMCPSQASPVEPSSLTVPCPCVPGVLYSMCREYLFKPKE